MALSRLPLLENKQWGLPGSVGCLDSWAPWTTTFSQSPQLRGEGVSMLHSTSSSFPSWASSKLPKVILRPPEVVEIRIWAIFFFFFFAAGKHSLGCPREACEEFTPVINFTAHPISLQLCTDPVERTALWQWANRVWARKHWDPGTLASRNKHCECS